MKVAITSQGADVKALIDSRFGRCAFFVIYDTENEDTLFLENPNLNSDQGAGPASVSFIANYGVTKVVSGEFGVKIKGMMDDLNIQMIIMKEPKSIEEIIKLLNSNK